VNIPQFSIQRPVTILMATLIAVLLGGIAYVRIPVDLMPDIVFPTLTVTTEYEGVAPEEIETLVSRPLEEAFAAAPGVEKVTSTSTEGQSMVRVEFAYGTNLDEAANELRTRLDRRRAFLPDDVQPSTIFKFDVSQFPVMFLTVSSPDMGPKELRRFVEKNIQYRLERVPGVAQFNVRGGLRRQIHVDLDLEKLRALDLSVSDIVRILRDENLNRPVGPVYEGQFEVLLRTRGEYQNLQDILNVAVTTRGGVPVQIRDIAEVEDSHEELRYMVAVNGEQAVRLLVYKQSGANTVEVSDGVWKEIEKIHRDYPNIRIEATRDTADFIRASIANLRGAALQGAGLAVIVLLLFLRSLSSTLIIGVAIPISVISTFALMYFNGFTLNTISFGGLALGVGMLVDNSIVVLENIYRHREKGKDRKEASIIGSRQVATAITASTLTTIAVFVPVLFISGMSGETFRQLATVVAFSLLCSLIVSLTVVPALCSCFLGAGRPARGGLSRVLQRAADGQQRLSGNYGRLISWALDHRKTVAASATLAFLGSLYLIPLIGVELQPEVDEGEIRVDLELEPGTRVEQTHAVVTRLAEVARETVPEAIYIMTEAGSSSPWRRTGTHTGELRIQLVEQAERDRSAQEIARVLRQALSSEPGMVVRTRVSGSWFRLGGGFGDQSDRLSVEIRGHDLTVMDELANQVRDAMQEVPGVAAGLISRQPGLPEMVVTVDRAKASSLGLNVAHVADTLETAIGGTRASFYREDGDEYDLVVRLKEEDRLTLDQVGQVPITTPAGQAIPAENILRMQRQEGPVEITRSDQQRIVVVSGIIAGRDLGSIVAGLQEKLADISRPPGFEFTFGGEWEEQQEAFRSMTFAAILALLLVYMVMASQFESLRDPFIILFSIPLAVIGVSLMLFLTGTTFNIQGFLGLIVLVGIVVNNAIVLVDYMNLLRRENGYSLREAVVTGGSRRLRPILMTTITTVLGLAPMAIGIGEGGELQAPLARVVIGGLTASTLITLVVIPTLYMALEERAERARLRGAAPAPDAGLAPVTGD